MRIRVNENLGQGHGRCYALVPDLFESDDFGNATAVNDGLVPVGMEEQAELAIDNCPEFAISVVEE